MKYCRIFPLILMVSACHNMPTRGHHETKECRKYRITMTAPMSPSAYDELKQNCIDSRTELLMETNQKY